MGKRNVLSEADVFDRLRPFESKIRQFFQKHGTAATSRYVVRCHKIKMSGAVIRKFLGISKNNHVMVKEAHRLALRTCGLPLTGSAAGGTSKTGKGGGRSSIASAQKWNAVNGGLDRN